MGCGRSVPVTAVSDAGLHSVRIVETGNAGPDVTATASMSVADAPAPVSLHATTPAMPRLSIASAPQLPVAHVLSTKAPPTTGRRGSYESPRTHDTGSSMSAADKVARLQSLPVFVLDNSVRETTVGQMRGHTLPDKRESHGGQLLGGGMSARR
jgi:hypothetical protein